MTDTTRQLGIEFRFVEDEKLLIKAYGDPAELAHRFGPLIFKLANDFDLLWFIISVGEEQVIGDEEGEPVYGRLSVTTLVTAKGIEFPGASETWWGRDKPETN